MPEPLYALWNDEYHKQQPAVQVRYLPEGSGAGATRVLTGTGDFAGGDAPIPEKELKAATTKVVELPTVLIGIVVVYNLPGTTGELHLSGPVLANIYLGKITTWNDPALVKLNPDTKLPAIPIQVFHRSAGKGSSYILSDFLSKVSPEFLSRAGRSESPNWPVGTTAGRSQDMTEKVAGTSGAIGYTELNMAGKASLRMASIRNAEGEFVRPSAHSVAAAAKALTSKTNDDFRISLTNAPGKDSVSHQQLYLVLCSGRREGFAAWPRGRRVFEMGIHQRRKDGAGTGLLPIARRTACQSDVESSDDSLNESRTATIQILLDRN